MGGHEHLAGADIGRVVGRGRGCRGRGGGICHLGQKTDINRTYRRIKTFHYAARALLPDDFGCSDFGRALAANRRVSLIRHSTIGLC